MKLSQIKTEVLSGLTIAVALVPEAISFAFLIGVAPQAGLWAAVLMAAITAVFGGRPGLISGATGATAIIMAGLYTGHGGNALYLGVIMAGLIQLIFWASSAWRLFEAIPPTVISGFLISLAIMIFMSQLKYLSVGNDSWINVSLTSVVSVISAAFMWYGSKFIKIPPAILAIVVGCVLGIPLGLATVGNLSSVSGSLPSFTVPTFTLSAALAALPYSIGMAIAGLTESLLTVESVSKQINEPGSKKRETLAQGVGNVVSGLFSTIGGCVLVGQTNLNIAAGSRNRLSSICAAVGLALIILWLANFIEMIPLAGLIGVMLIVVLQTGDWSSLFKLKSFDLIVLLITIFASLLTSNPAIGVIVGTVAHYSSKIRS
jgi:SulP family sulfate permease